MKAKKKFGMGLNNTEQKWRKKIIKYKTRKNAIVECLDYQIPVTQLKGSKGNGDMQAAKRD